MNRTANLISFGLAPFFAALLVMTPGYARAAGIGGSARLTPVGILETGPCSQQPYSDVCPSGVAENCSCQEYQGKFSGHFGGRGGRGNATLFITTDEGMRTTAPLGCRPMFASGHLDTPLGIVDFTAHGTVCDPVGKSPATRILGGFGASGAVNEGFGTVSGSFNQKLKVLSISFSGRSQ